MLKSGRAFPRVSCLRFWDLRPPFLVRSSILETVRPPVSGVNP